MLQALYDAYGVDAVFTPAGGGAGTAVRVRSERPREDVTLGEVGIEAEKRRLRVRMAEIAPVLGAGSARGGTFVLTAGETLRVKRTRLNLHRDEYRFGCEVVT